MKRKAPKINIGDTFDDNTVIAEVPTAPGKVSRYLCKCNVCGREREMCRTLLIDKKGTTHKACGKGLKTTNKRFYSIWCGMRQRTTNPKTEHWDCYGGRGISSDAFEYFIDFYDAMYPSYLEAIEEYGDEKVLSIDRIDPNGDYEPDNCRWISLSEQKGNMRKNRLFEAISPDGKRFEAKNQSLFAREHGLSDKQINACLSGRFKTHLGWSFSYIKKCNDYPEAQNA